MKEVTPLQKWFNNYKLTHPEITSKVIAERMNVSGAMFTYLLSGERELTLNRFNTLIDALDIKRGTKAHKELMDVRRLMPQTFNIHIPTTTSESVRESLNELITKNRLEFTITRK